MNVRVRELPGLQAMALSQPSDADLAEINARFSRVVLQPGEIHVRQAKVAHNFHDRTGERFTGAVLERFSETLQGKSFLGGHDTGSTPLGRWFRADVRNRPEEAFPVLMTEPTQKSGKASPGVEIVPGFANQRVRVKWLESAFYFVNDPATDRMRKDIDSGVWQDVSIGFSFDRIDCDLCKADYLGGKCPHLFMRRDAESGILATGTYAGDPQNYEARETSSVYLGAQQGAEFVKQIRDGRVDPKALAATPFGEDLVALKLYEQLAREHGHAQKVWAFSARDIERAKSSVISGSPEVIEQFLGALLIGAPKAAADAPNYHAAGDGPACATCEYYAEGRCIQFDFAADPAMTCDDHEPQEMDEGEDALEAPVSAGKAAEVTNFPGEGDDQAVSLRNSEYPQFDRAYAEALREDYPGIWSRGGNIRGNAAFTLWGRARDGETTAGVLDWIREREAWAARHYANNRLAGVVAQVKWGVVGTLGVSGMKALINEAKEREDARAATGPLRKKAMRLGHTSAMLALMLPADVASELAMGSDSAPAGVEVSSADELHLTLAYLGKIDEIGEQEQALIQRFDAWAASAQPVTGVISGTGRFTGGDEGDAFYASFDSPALLEWRQRLVEEVQAAGIEPASNHGFTPHITLAYLPASEPTPNVRLEPRTVAMPQLCLAWGNNLTVFDLGGSKSAQTSRRKTALPLSAAEAAVTPPDGGKTATPADTTPEGVPSALPGDDSMKLLEKLKSLGRVSAEATEADAEKALEDLHADASKATDAETARDAAEAAKAALEAEKATLTAEVAELKAAAPLLAIGEQALKSESDRYITEAKKLGRPEKEVAIVAQSYVDRKDYEGLKALADETFDAVCAKYPDRIGRTEQELEGEQRSAAPTESFRLA